MNISVLAFYKAHELGWVCLGLCSLDVIVNATVLFWLTSGSTRETGSTSHTHSEPQGLRRQYYLSSSAPPSAPQSPWKSAFSDFDGPPPRKPEEHEMTLSPPTSPRKASFDRRSASSRSSSHRKAPSVLILPSKPNKSTDLKITVTTETEIDQELETKSLSDSDKEMV